LNDKTLVVRASCPLDMYLITPGMDVSGLALKIVVTTYKT